MSVEETGKVLQDLKKIVMLTGQLSEVHVSTLKNSPFIFFDGLKKLELSYDIKVGDTAGMPGMGSKVAFVLHLDKSTPNDFMEKRVSALKKTVHAILWPEVMVSITDENGKDL